MDVVVLGTLSRHQQPRQRAQPLRATAV